MAQVIVVGGGFAGSAAALAAARVGAKVTLLERTDLLLGAGLRAGRMNNNGKIVAAEEMKEMGGGDFFAALESVILHRGNIVSEVHGYTYDTRLVEPLIRQLLREGGVEIEFEARAVDVIKENDEIRQIILPGGDKISGDVFLDCTGSAGGVANCMRYGKGCVMCYCYRCPTYGDRVSIATKAGAPELVRRRPDGTPGAVGAAICLYKETLAAALREELESQGVASIPLPPEMVDYSKMKILGPQRDRKQFEFLNLVDIGVTAKCVAIGFMPLEWLRKLPGLEKVQIEEPMGGGKYNKIGRLSMTRRDNAMKVEGLKNLFCAGEKAGPGSGIAEVIALGVLAGYNAVRRAEGKALLELPRQLVTGDFIAFLNDKVHDGAGLENGYHMGHGAYWERMKATGLYAADPQTIRQRVKDAGLSKVFEKL